MNDDALADLRTAATKPHKHKGYQPKLFDPEEEGTEDEARCTLTRTSSNASKNRVSELSWEDMEELTAGPLRTMDFHAHVNAKGAGGGRDVVASPDALGLESPHIVAEVKHRKGPMGAPAVRSFIGGLGANGSGLYVSTGGFSKDARIEADRDSEGDTAPRPHMVAGLARWRRGSCRKNRGTPVGVPLPAVLCVIFSARPRAQSR